MNGPKALIRVHFAQGTVEEFWLSTEGYWGWRLDQDRRVLVIRTTPLRRRTEIPLENVRYFEVLTIPAVDADDCDDHAAHSKSGKVFFHPRRSFESRLPPQGVSVGGVAQDLWSFGDGNVAMVGTAFVGYVVNFDPGSPSYELCLVSHPDKVSHIIITEPELWPDQRFVYGLLPIGDDGERQDGVCRSSSDEQGEVRDQVSDLDRPTGWRPGNC